MDMWDVARDFHGQILNRAPVDSALVVWHSDYTEIMNSGRRLAPGDVRGRTFGIAHPLDAFGGRHLSCCRKLCQSNRWRPLLPAGDQGYSNYEGNLSPGADRQAMIGEIKRFLPPATSALFVTW